MSEIERWTVYLCPDCGKPDLTRNATEVYGFESSDVCTGYDADLEQEHREPVAVEYVPLSTAERMTTALALLRGHVKDNEGWKIINDALWLGPRDENDEPIRG